MCWMSEVDGKIDVQQVDPLLYGMAGLHYWSLGSQVGSCWNIGKSMKKAKS